MGTTANISIRVNPDVAVESHPYISTGLKDNKFGITYKNALALYMKASKLASLNIIGIDFHIGSQITSIQPL
jgi:diaminopimelate decarboxylase